MKLYIKILVFIAMHSNIYSDCNGCNPNTYFYLDGLESSECVNYVDDLFLCNQSNVSFLSEMISNNELDVTEINIGNQYWENGYLKSFMCEGCNIQTLPASLGALIELEFLNLFQNNIVLINEEIGNLTKLKALILDFNDIDYLPESIQFLDKIEWLYLNDNNLSYIPNVLEGWREIKRLYVNNNQLVSIPNSITFSDSLLEIYANNNNISTLPDSINNLEYLQTLHLANNDLAILPDSFCDLNCDWGGAGGCCLANFDINNNFICPPYPECISSISILGIQDCQWSIEGDANLDSIVDVVDIVLAVSIILNDYEVSDFEYLNSDCNNDGLIDVLDVLLISQIILS